MPSYRTLLQPFAELMDPAIKKLPLKCNGKLRYSVARKCFFYENERGNFKEGDYGGCRLELDWPGNALLRENRDKIAGGDHLNISGECVSAGFLRPYTLFKYEFFYGVKFDNGVVVKEGDLLARLSELRKIFEPMGFLVGCYIKDNKESKKPGWSTADVYLRMNKKTEFCLYIYKEYGIKTTYKIREEHNLEAEEALALYKKEVVDQILPNLEKIFQNLLVIGVEAVKR